MPDVLIDIEVQDHGAPKKIKETDNALGQMKNQAEKSGSAFSGMWKQFAGGMLVVDGLKKAFGAVSGFLTSSIKEAKEAEVAEHNLSTALDLTGRSRSAMLPGLINFSQEIQDTTRFTQEEAEASLTLLTQLTNLDSKGLKNATKGAVGLASVMGIDLNSATMMVTKAMEGNYTALGRYGITVDKTLPKEEQRNQLLEKLLGFYGRATAETETFSGRVNQLGKAWNDVKEAVGKAITENETIKRIIGEITEKLTTLIKSGAIEEWATKGVNAIIKLIEGFGLLKTAILELPKGVSGLGGMIAEHVLGIDKQIGGAIDKAKQKVIEFKEALQVLKPSMEELRTESEKGEKSWLEYTSRMKEMDSQLVANKSTVEGWIDKGLKFLGIHTELPPEIKKTGDALGDATEKTKTLAEQLGIVTKIELENKLRLYKEALDQYTDSNQLTTKAKDDLLKKIKDLEIELGIYKGYLSDIKNELLTGVIPSTRDFKGELAGLPEDLKNLGEAGVSSLELISDGAAKVTADTKNYFDGLFNDIATGFGNTIQTWLSGATTFRDFMKGIWGDIKNAFFRMVGEMIAKWIVDFLGSLVKDTAKAATDIASSFANALGGVSKSVGSIASGLLSSLGSIGSIISGITSVIGLLSGPKKQGDVTYWLKLIWENTQNLWNTMTWLPNTFDTMNQQLQTLKDIGWALKPALTTRLDKANAYLRDIAQGIADLPSAQSGAFVTRDALVKVHAGETITPRGHVYNNYSSPTNRISLSFTINAIDRRGMKEAVQDEILPIIIEAVSQKGNFKSLGSKFNKALGLT